MSEGTLFRVPILSNKALTVRIEYTSGLGTTNAELNGETLTVQNPDDQHCVIAIPATLKPWRRRLVVSSIIKDINPSNQFNKVEEVITIQDDTTQTEIFKRINSVTVQNEDFQLFDTDILFT